MPENDAKTEVHYLRDSLRAMVGWRQNLVDTTVPDGKVMPPLVWEQREKLPVIGPMVRMKQITKDPVGLVRRLAREHREGFTIRVPSTFDFTFLLHEDAYRLVMSLPATHAAIGQVLDRMPTVGYWFPRSGAGPDSLQELIVAGRRMMAEMLPHAAMPQFAERIGGVVDRHVATWGDTVDLTANLYPLVYEASCRYFTGDRIWDDLGGELTRLYREIVKGIEITHIAASQTAGRYFMPEYRATRRLHRLLRGKLPRYADADSPLIKAIRRVRIDGMPLSAADSLWMFMYVLWNATVYPGAYVYWTLVDVVTRPELVERVHAAEGQAERRDLLARCLLENIRLYPVSSLIRYLRRPLEYRHDGRDYHIPDGQMVGVLPGVTNLDPERIPDPHEFDPDRHVDGPMPREGIFGRGAFGCVAGEFNKTLAATVLDEVLTRYDFRLLGALPQRQLRVPEIHPTDPLPVRLTPRARPRMALTTETVAPEAETPVARCPFTGAG
ncbi:MAG: cytochrome P450 [Kibdelosporangium sp.]